MAGGALLKLFQFMPGCASIACPFVFFGKAFEGGGKWYVPDSEKITVFRSDSGGSSKFYTNNHVKAVLGLVGKKKHKNNGLERVVVVDFKNINADKNWGSNSLKGAVKIAQKINADSRKDEFQDVNDGISWKFLGVEGEKVVGYMIVARLNEEGGKLLPQLKADSSSGGSALELKHVTQRKDDKPVCSNRGYNLMLALQQDFTVEWRGQNTKLGVIAPKIVGNPRHKVISKMKQGCEDRGYFVTSNVYFWIKNGKEENATSLFSEESSATQGKALHVKDTIKNVIYDNIENIELTLNGLKDSFGNTMSWGEGSKPIVNLQIKR
ncbi:hypothetical protein WEN_00285 [Mycoplasma wenyonii str. Massachusetts]|uniref:Uncharacterized protein n=1 Tax=Mycoplasma wenyonii (strain Massachusetts) TaxID=1197325 RepID=I6YKW7_MYCWM|nr:hypothetical protein [Mycoplasma wenyonii]AFN64864.1 hypothetical protein WEN_00285 [Mycoplasma wenyonii str. Massachusetts]